MIFMEAVYRLNLIRAIEEAEAIIARRKMPGGQGYDPAAELSRDLISIQVNTLRDAVGLYQQVLAKFKSKNAPPELLSKAAQMVKRAKDRMVDLQQKKRDLETHATQRAKEDEGMLRKITPGEGEGVTAPSRTAGRAGGGR